jgi:hypothetical protein
LKLPLGSAWSIITSQFHQEDDSPCGIANLRSVEMVSAILRAGGAVAAANFVSTRIQLTDEIVPNFPAHLHLLPPCLRGRAFKGGNCVARSGRIS